MVLWDEKGRRRFARYLERSPRIVKVICAVPGILLALEVAFGALALLDNGGEALATGTADIRTCTRDPLTGWVMYRCELEGADGSPIDPVGLSRGGAGLASQVAVRMFNLRPISSAVGTRPAEGSAIPRARGWGVTGHPGTGMDVPRSAMSALIGT